MNYFVVILIVCRLNKNQPYVHLSKIDDEGFGVSTGDKALNKQQPTKEKRNYR